MKLLLCVTGGIAAYRACEFTSLAVKAGHDVRVLMTQNATRFVGPLTFEGLCGHPPIVGQQHVSNGHGMEHIDLARWADLACVAPATANTIARLAMGLADDAITTAILALPPTTPVIVAPAMNTQMWDHPATQRNLGWLTDLGRTTVLPPVRKRLACGDVGVGGLPEPSDILRACQDALPR